MYIYIYFQVLCQKLKMSRDLAKLLKIGVSFLTSLPFRGGCKITICFRLWLVECSYDS